MGRSPAPSDYGQQGHLEGITPELASRLFRANRKTVVLGDTILDTWLSGRCERLCREAPAPVVDVERRWDTPGGAGNTAANLAALGCRVQLVTAVGTDSHGDLLVNALQERGVGTEHVVASEYRNTTTKQRVMADDQVLFRFDDGGPHTTGIPESLSLVDRLHAALDDADALVICDYDTGVLDGGVRDALLDMRAHLPLVVVDAREPHRWRFLAPDIVTPNSEETAHLLGSRLPTGQDRLACLEKHRARLLSASGARALAVTLDRDGAALLTPDAMIHRTWTRPVPDQQTAGAGDTFVAALTVALTNGLTTTAGIELAQAAADVVVHRPGTAVCTAHEMEQRFGSHHEAPLERTELRHIVAEHRSGGRRVVFTNGCFDVLHSGHVAYLNEAKQLGDVLIVAVNSDESVRRIKGSDRPVNPVRDRAAVLAALSCVDHVTVFAENTPRELLRTLQPDIYAKGGDYTPDTLPETPVVHDYGGEVTVLQYVPDQSTSMVIERIRATAVA